MDEIATDSRLGLEYEGFIWKVWDGDVVVYDSLSGDSHRVASPAGLIVSIAQREGVMRFEDLSGRVMQCSGLVRFEGAAVESAAKTLLSIGILRHFSIQA